MNAAGALPTGSQFLAAREALRDGLAAGIESGAAPRQRVDVASGQLLLMPAAGPQYVGVKVVSVSDSNPARGLPRVQGTYVLMDAATLTPVWHGDGATITNLRTAAVSLLALDLLLCGRAVRRAAVIGLGPAGCSHAAGLAALHTPGEVLLIGRDADRTAAAARSVDARAGTVEELPGCDVVICATGATTPLFDRRAIADDAVVIAVGTHSPHHAELPAELIADAQVYLESTEALAEAGDVLLAMDAFPQVRVAATLGELVRGQRRVAEHGPWVFKSVGAGWQDLCVAAAMYGVGLSSASGLSSAIGLSSDGA